MTVVDIPESISEDQRGFPHPDAPAGWYQIGWSDEFAVGDVRPMRYFGVDLVAYRAASSRIVVLDAHCPHLGAHLGYGGQIDGDNIICPFHGWKWASDGTNVDIPDGSPPNRAQRLSCWSVAENSGLVLLWFDPRGNEPTWTPPPLVGRSDAYDSPATARRQWDVRVHPQFVAENAVDSLHFSWVHKAGSNPEIIDIVDRGANLHVTQAVVFGGKKRATWLTPNGPVKGSLEIDLWGLGLAHTRFAGADEAYSLVAATPVERDLCHYRMTNWMPKPLDGEDGSRADRRIEEQFKQAERDFVIWEHMRYVARPPFSRTEARPYRAFRAWAQRFYDGSVVTFQEAPRPE